VKGKKFRNPETGNEVQFGSLPAEEQKKLRHEWSQKDKEQSPKDQESGKGGGISPQEAIGRAWDLADKHEDTKQSSNSKES